MKSIVTLIQESQAIPETELSASPDKPVAKGETVIGEASLTVKQLYTYRNRLADNAKKLAFGTLSDIGETLSKLMSAIQEPTDADGEAAITKLSEQLEQTALQSQQLQMASNDIDHVMWDAIRVETNESDKDIGIREGWQIVTLKPQSRTGIDIIRIGPGGVSRLSGIDDISRLFS